MKILLLGAQGRLGQKIAQKFKEQNISFEPVTRAHTASLETFKTFIEQQSVGPKSLLILDVSLPQVTHDVANFLLSMSFCDSSMSSRDSSMSSRDSSMSSRDSSMSSRGLTAGSSSSICLGPVVKPRGDNAHPRGDNAHPQIDSVYGMIIGTTGHTAAAQNTFEKLSTLIPVCIAPNFSKGIFLLGELLKSHLTNGETIVTAAKKLGFTISLHDSHHQHKKDSPSGTALMLGKLINLDKNSIHSTRVGEVIGDHTLALSGQNETLELSHKAISRDVFAEGATELSVLFFKKNFGPGLYLTSDIW